MKAILIVTIALTIFACSKTKEENNQQSEGDSLATTKLAGKEKPATTDNDTTSFLLPIPKDFIISEVVSDSDVVTFDHKCVVFANYSEGELAEKEKSMSEEGREAFYDDMSYYGNNASLFLYEKTITERVDNKKYIRFVFASGKELTVDRRKSVETIFFFNPEKGIKQCDTRGFIKEKYQDY